MAEESDKTDENTEHFALAEYENFHECFDKKTEDGRCLNGRCMGHYDAKTCSYRFQGREAAREYLHIYNREGIDEKAYIDDVTGSYRDRVTKGFDEKDIETKIPINGKKEVEVIGSKGVVKKISIRKKVANSEYETTDIPSVVDKVTKEKRPRKGYEDFTKVEKTTYWFLNFTVGSVPWKNQVHHVLNQSSLNKVLSSFEENIKITVIKMLLDPKIGGKKQPPYNINHKENMVILPTEDEWCRETGLPRHGSHPTYNEKILKEVKDAFTGVEKINADAGNKKHKIPKAEEIREDLREISKDWYKKIIDVVSVNRNKSEADSVKTVNEIK